MCSAVLLFKDTMMTNNFYYAIVLFALLFFSFSLKAQTVEVEIKTNGDIKRETIAVPEGMTYPIDSLLNDWHIKTYIDINKNCETAPANPQYDDSTFIDRLQRIPAVIEMPYNPIVRKFIDLYTERLRSQVSYMLSVSNFYIPIFETALDSYNLPLELKYLPIIESALNPIAVSRAGACGLWQFMINTSKLYGLETNSLIDERKDPVKSTWAAARYLKDLYEIYKDWNLTIAAYNCGPGNVNKAIRRAGGETDYWKIYSHLPKETQGYVPAFIAANYVMHYYCDHNICAMETSIPESTDTIQVNQKLHFKQIEELCGTNMEELKSLNPQYNTNVIPGDIKPYTLRLPLDQISSFIEKQDTIYNHRSDELFQRRTQVAVTPQVKAAPKRKSPATAQGKLVYHKIRSGETLSTIAQKHKVTVRQLRQWNNIRGNKIIAGKSLKIYK